MNNFKYLCVIKIISNNFIKFDISFAFVFIYCLEVTILYSVNSFLCGIMKFIFGF